MYKLFTVEEATQLIPTVDRVLRDMQSAMGDAIALRDSMMTLKPFSVAARNAGEELNFLLRNVHEHKADLDRLGVHIKDIDTGLIDFPSQLGAEVVYLSWAQGQHAITHYHRLNENDEARRPLPERFISESASA